MRGDVRAARVALFVVTGLLLVAAVAAAQVDLAKVLVGTWQGELRSKRSNIDLTLLQHARDFGIAEVAAVDKLIKRRLESSP